MIAQSVEQLPFKQWVPGSSPGHLTIYKLVGIIMAKECFVCEKKAVVGGSITHRGIAKKHNGIGLQLVKNNKRVFKPNLQKVKFVHQGHRRSRWVCTACIRSGNIAK